MNLYSVEYIKEEVSIADILDYYGADLSSGWANPWADWVSIRCPFHDDQRPSAGMNQVEEVFHCFVCDIRGDIFNVVMEVEGMEFKEALDFVVEVFL